MSTLWVVEEYWCGEWVAWADNVRPTRRRARAHQRNLKAEDSDYILRIRKYVREERARSTFTLDVRRILAEAGVV